jgi:Tfp pilus assembly protein PilX
MSAHRRSLQDERGIAMVYVVIVMMVMTLIAFTTLQTIQNEQTASATQSSRQTAYQAAEAGIDDYLQKLHDNPQYYSQFVNAAESSRRDLPSSTIVAAGTTCTSSTKPASPAWTYPTVLAAAAGGYPAGAPEWDYPSGKNHWCQTTNGYEFNLQITPPTSSNAVLTIEATGRKTGATNTNDYRVVEDVLSPSSILRYYRIVDGDIGFGSTTTTGGMVWSNGNISHAGVAQADLWATGSITGGVSMQNGSVQHPNESTPINFSTFLASLSDISRAAQVNYQAGNTPTSTYFNDASRDAWKLVFSNAGTFTAQACDMTDGPDSGSTPDPVAKTNPVTNCTSAQTYTVPSNGAVYSPQDVIVSGTVKGRVTVASNADIILGGALNPATPGTDAIGLDAQVNLIIATYVPSSLTWNASILAQTGTWCTYHRVDGSGRETCGSGTSDNDPSSPTGALSVMNFSGSSSTADGGDMTMFDTRNYDYDDNLRFLLPPWFPSQGNPWITSVFRELPAAS